MRFSLTCTSIGSVVRPTADAFPSVPPEYSRVLKVSMLSEVATVPETIWNLPLTPVRLPDAMKSVALLLASSLLPIVTVEEAVSSASDTDDVPVILRPPVVSDPASNLVFEMLLFPVTLKALMSVTTALEGKRLPPTVTVSRLLSLGSVSPPFHREKFPVTVKFSVPCAPVTSDVSLWGPLITVSCVMVPRGSAKVLPLSTAKAATTAAVSRDICLWGALQWRASFFGGG